MIKRTLAQKLHQLVKQYPVITITGPRQSGKTTLVRSEFKDYRYFSLENPDTRQIALTDPRGFLNSVKTGTILDEIQRAPDLVSYIQTMVDEDDQPGRFILTGSQNFLLFEKISQSLAGRTAILHLLPFSKRELLGQQPITIDSFPVVSEMDSYSTDLWQLLYQGFYPRIHDKQLNPTEWYAWYYQTYIERDVRLLQNIGDINTFTRFVRLCAGRNGQPVNFTNLAADAGITHTTARRWLSILQASFIVALVQPYHENFRKRITKSPKLYFFDTGLLAFLLGIRNAEELQFHAMRGSVFESFVFSELHKMFVHSGQIPSIYFWSDSAGHEIDFIVEQGSRLIAIEAKSGETFNDDFIKGLQYFSALAGERVNQSILIFSGKENFTYKNINILSWQAL